MHSETMLGADMEPHHPLRSMLNGRPDDEAVYAEKDGDRLFKIRSADSHGHRSSASVLINRMYATRGYRVSPLPERQLPTRITLTATDHDDVVGTITVGFDSDSGLFVDDLFRNETNALRNGGRRLCEFTKLAMDSAVKSKRVLASLFHVAYIYAHRLMGYDDLLIEVNPRHVRYYHQMLGFDVISEPRMNTRVGAPAVLLRLELAHCQEQLEKLGGKPDLAQTERSLYPLSFAPHEEAAIVARLQSAQPDWKADYVPLTSENQERIERMQRSMH